MRQRFGYLLSALLFVACGGKILAESAVVDDAGTSSTKVTPAIAPSPAPTVEAPDATPPPAPRESLPDSAQTIRLGSFADGAIVRFNIPAGVLGFELLVRGQPADIVRLEQLTSPAGDYVFDDAKPRGTEVRTGEGVGWASGAVPQAAVYEKSPVEPGAWTAKLGTRASGAGTLSVSLVLQRTLDGAFHGGELDLHVYVPVGLQLSNPGTRHEITLANASSDPAIQARLDAFFDLLQRLVGIERVRVAFYEIPRRFLKLDDQMSLNDAFSETRVVPSGQALHVVFTHDLGGALGIAPAIPGGDQETGLLTRSQVRVLRGCPVYRARATGAIVAPPRHPLPRLSHPSKLPSHVRRCRLVTR